MADLVCSVVQIAVGLCLGIAALAKASAFRLFVEGVASYRMVPRMVVGSFGGAIVVAEALIAACFLSGVLVAQAAVAASFLLIVFGVAALVARLRGIATACFCFGADGGESTTAKGLLRHLLLLGGIGVTLDYRLSDFWNDPVLTIPGWEIFAASVAVLLAAAWVIEIPELLAVGRRELFEEESER